MIYLCWDIDGTLLLTNKAGYAALARAAQDYLRLREPYRFTHTLAGCTDSSIIKEIVTSARGKCDSGTAAGLMLTYETYLKEELKKHKGRLMPNVEKTLLYVRDECPDMACCLMTGNTTEGGRLKVAEYGIAEYFDLRLSGYGDLAEKRDDIARILYTRLLTAGKIKSTDQTVFIGDTPLDVMCAEAIGSKCIIVLAGSEYKREDFRDNAPFAFLDELPDDPADFTKLARQAAQSAAS